MENIKWIYNHLGDEISKKIFSLRYMHYLTGDYSFLLQTCLTRKEVKEVHTRLMESNRRKLIFGAGVWGEGILRTFNDIEWECFVDNCRDEKGLRECAGKRVISFREYLDSYKDELIIISSRVYNQQIYLQLKNAGILDDNIINIGEINDHLNEEQYFDLPQLKNAMSNQEYFVDAGSLDGRSAVCFKEWSGDRFGKVYIIEPDKKNLELCIKNLQYYGIQKYEIISSGLWNKKTTLSFEENNNGTSKVMSQSEGNTKIPVDKLDDLINDGIVTFIKMDIEGSEYNALLGSERTIREQRPKLAICVYHKPDDIILIPSTILSFNPDYKLYLRHYSTIWGETVLYAI